MKKIFLLFLFVIYNSVVYADIQGDAEYMMHKGQEYYVKGNYNLAIESYTKSIKLYEKLIESDKNAQEYLKRNRMSYLGMVYSCRGDGYKNSKEFNKALKDYTKAIEYSNGYHSYYTSRAEVYMKKKNYELAIQDCNEAIKRNNNYEAFFQRGYAEESLKQYDLAIQDYTKILEISPRCFEARYRIAQCYEKLGDNEKAIEFYHSFYENINLDVHVSNEYLKNEREYAKKQIDELSK